MAPLSLWQLTVPSVMLTLSHWRSLDFSVWCYRQIFRKIQFYTLNGDDDHCWKPRQTWPLQKLPKVTCSSLYSLRPSDAYVRELTRPSLAKIMAPSHYLNQWCHVFNWILGNKFQWNSNHFHLKCLWKRHLQNDSHFVSASKYKNVQSSAHSPTPTHPLIQTPSLCSIICGHNGTARSSYNVYMRKR